MPAPTPPYLLAVPWIVRGIFALEVVLAAWACGGAPRTESPAPAGRIVAPDVRVAADGGASRAGARFVGRFDRSDPRGPRFAWSASMIEVRFRGSGLVVRLRLGPIRGAQAKTLPYAVEVDGVSRTIDADPGTEAYTIATGLDPTREHTARITREAEAFAGVHQLLGLEPIDGVLLPPDTRARPVVEVVGDSITCGYGALGADARCHFSFATERATASYAFLAARSLDADVTTLCWSGRGVIKNYDGDPEPRMPELFEAVLPQERGAPRWDFAREAMPVAVVVNLGTNDWFSDGDHDGRPDPLDVDAYEAGYARFLERLRVLRPRAPILVTTSPMLEGAIGVASRASLARVVERRRTAGDARVSLVTLSEQGQDVGCDAHPNAEKHRALARELADALRSVLR